MIGGILIKAAFLAALVAVLAYVRYMRVRQEVWLRVARTGFLASVAGVIAGSGVLLSLILTHQFQFTYVWSYSSRELSTPLLISTFYAGQEGSFLLWTLFTSLIGVFLLRHSARHGYEPEVMSVYGGIQLALLLMLLVKNPFLYVWESWPGEVQAGFMPANGRGLNPLLQNYWMVIHPQVLFSGFAAMGVPYAYAMAALLKRDYDQWFKPATPWLVFGALVLGTGIMMGGFWAYETLGWGGYWGWDPVENSSLVPWLTSIAAIHMILSQRKSGAFVRTNLVLGVLGFILVLYSTFLTRSGVLGDTSVHSFVDPGMWAYVLLVGMMTVFSALPVILIVLRWKEMPRRPVTHDVVSREFALFVGAAAVLCVALLVLVGTSAPIITDILEGKKSAVDISFYSTTTLPLGIAIALLAGIGQLLWWTKSDRLEFLRSLLSPFLLALAVTLGTLVAGIREPLLALFVFGAAFALFANLMVGWRIARGNPKFAGGAIAHVGLAVMFFGFLTSSEYDSEATVTLPQGTAVRALGYELTYLGVQPIQGPEERYAFRVRVTREGRTFVLAPVMYYSNYNEGLMRHPDIANLLSRDFYLAPLEFTPGDSLPPQVSDRATLRQGETASLMGIEVSYLGMRRNVFQKSSGGSTPVDVVLLATPPGGASSRVVVTAASSAVVDGRYEISLAGTGALDPAGRPLLITLETRDLAQADAARPERRADVLVVEASVKPYINFVWSGVIILLLGFIVTIIRRSPEAAMRTISGA
jgi:cytochrome c-type biogenesis protein CcmF